MRLYSLQIINGDYYSALALGQQGNYDEFIPHRGEIYLQDNAGADRFLIATTREMPMVYAVPREIETGFERDVLNALDNIVDIDDKETETLLRRLENKDSTYTALARQLTEEQAARVKELAIDGIYIRGEQVRFYPAGNFASHLLGFVGFTGDAKEGQYGVEGYYNSLLAGKVSENDLLNTFFAVPDNEPILQEGATIELTIDYGVQFAVEKKLYELMDRLDADGASAIFMDPKTGEIIAMASLPSFDPNTYNEAQNAGLFLNDNTQAVFEPGSIFKPITLAAAIDAGAVSPQTTYTDEGHVRIGSYTIANFDGRSNGVQTMTQVLEKSLNTGAIFAQQELGKKKFREYLEAFQLDSITGVDLSGEATNNIDNIKNTSRDINFATASFGQGIAFTPLRLLTSFSAIANDGIIMRPYIVSSIRQDGQEVKTEPKEMAAPISARTASRLVSMLTSVIENGFDRKAVVPGYNIAGKTGTAQVPNADGPGYSDKTIHSFVGFAPSFNPRFIGIIKVENPHGIRFAADSLSPAFRELASFILQYYKIPPQ